MNYTVLFSSHSTNTVTFDINEMILRMFTNKSIFAPQNILLDQSNSYLIHRNVGIMVILIQEHSPNKPKRRNVRNQIIFLYLSIILVMD